MKTSLLTKTLSIAAFIAMYFTSLSVLAQVKVGDNPTNINANAALDVESTNKGLLLPRIGLTATTNPAPLTAHVAGMSVYNTATANDVTPGFYYNDGTKWVATVGASVEPNYNYTFGSGAPTGSCNSGDLYTDTLSTSPTVGQQFVCSGGSWVSYTAPNRTAWFLNGTTNDAGGTKAAHIIRPGTVTVGSSDGGRFARLTPDGGLKLYRSPSGPVGVTNGYIDFSNSTTDSYPMRIALRSDAAIGDLALSFQDHSTPRMTLTQAGLLGVGRFPGTTYGAFGAVRMEVQGSVRAMADAGFPGFYPIMANNDPDLSPVFIGLRSRGTIDAPTFVQTGDNIGLIAFRDHQNHGSQIVTEATQNHTAAAAGTNLSFWTVPNNGVVTTRRMTIDQDGQVGIATPAPTATLSVNGTANKPGGGSWTVLSDSRVKKNIADYKKGLKQILAIRPVSFQYNGKGGFSADGKTHVGVVAQEMEKILPSTISTINADGIKDLRQYNDSELTYTLINAVKEQQAEIEALKSANTKLQAQASEVATLKAEMASIKAMLGVNKEGTKRVAKK